jgi:transposase
MPPGEPSVLSLEAPTMAARRTAMHRLEELVRLTRMGTKTREVARLLGMSPNTEREYRSALEAEGLLWGPADELPALELLKAAVDKHKPSPELPPQQRSQIEDWTDTIAKLIDKGVGPRAIYDRLRTEEPGFPGTYPQVKRLCRALRRARGARPDQVAIPVETGPGEVAQVDFGHVGKLLDPLTGQLRDAWCFVMVLGFSRRMVVRVVFDQKTETWLRLHVEAFEELGGVIETVVPDNLKAAVVRAAFSPTQSTALNRSYRELAKHYGFKIDPTPPRAAPKKGKVEAGVKYVKRSFFRGREGEDVTQVRRALEVWVHDVANERMHGTLQRRPAEVFEALEGAALRPLPARGFEPVVWKEATVHRDTHVCFERRLYSVPWRLIGKAVWVRATQGSVMIYADDTRVATHDRRGPGPRSTIAEHLPVERADLRHRHHDYWITRAGQMGAEVEQYIREVFDSDQVLSMLRRVQAMVRHLETFPVERARRACLRASFYGSHGYGALKSILSKALDLEPLPVALVPAAATSTSSTSEDALSGPRFARRVSDLLRAAQEASDEPN